MPDYVGNIAVFCGMPDDARKKMMEEYIANMAAGGHSAEYKEFKEKSFKECANADGVMKFTGLMAFMDKLHEYNVGKHGDY